MQTGQCAANRRGGAVIVVVLSLLASLAFLGFFFYSWTSQEARSAQAFAREGGGEATLDPQLALDDALRQIIVATPKNRRQSALHSGEVTYAGQRMDVSSKSLAASVVGLIREDGAPLDVRPRNGRGISVYALGTNATTNLPEATTATDIGFDYDGDYNNTAATLERDGTNFRFNFGALASGSPYPFDLDANPRFLHFPDVDYTYPDINSPYLAYDAVLPFDTNGDTVISQGEGIRVIVPSFQRTQLFPDYRVNGFRTLYADANTQTQVLRPHQQHAQWIDETALGVDFNGNGSADPPYPVARYLTADTPALSGDRSRVIPPFVFQIGVNEDSNNNGILDPNEDDGPGGAAPDDNGNGVLDRPNDMGIFTGPGHSYQLDADADGDGVLDSIWLDLDHPIVDLPDGRQVVPLYYAKIIDLDALLNVNYHGHSPLLTAASNTAQANALTQVYGLTNAWIHASNQGTGPAEVNPAPALYADPTNNQYIDTTDINNYLAATRQARGMFADQSLPGTNPARDRTNDGAGVDGMNRVQMANAELLSMLSGRPVYADDLTYANSNPASDIPGRYGEVYPNGVPTLRLALEQLGNGRFPSAGATLLDDDRDDNFPANDWAGGPEDNYASGISHLDDFGGLLNPALRIPSAVHPLDYTGLANYEPVGGSYRQVNGTGGVRDLAGLETFMPINPSRWLYYGTRNTVTMVLTPAAWENQDDNAPAGWLGVRPWTKALAGSGDSLQSMTVVNGAPYDGLLNENDEIVTEGAFPTAVDAPYPPAENAGVLLSDSDWRQVDGSSRLRQLLPFNFEGNRKSQDIRRQFAADSRDRLEHGHAIPIGEDANLNGILDPNEDDGAATMPIDDADGVLDGRRWEFADSEDLNGDGAFTSYTDDYTNTVTEDQNGSGAIDEFRFPPRFPNAQTAAGKPAASRHEQAVIAMNDPFRPVVRRLLTIEQNNNTNISDRRYLPGQRLNINRLLVNFDRNGNPIYRHLTPHATFRGNENDTNHYLIDATGNIRTLWHPNLNYLQSYYDDGQALSVLDPDLPANAGWAAVPYAVIDDNEDTNWNGVLDANEDDGNVTFPPDNANGTLDVSGKFAQEAWARHDRQRLARDIYTLLYTLGCPDNIDPTRAAYPATEDVNPRNGIDDQIDRMAQFAVNYVDALDVDDVITRFEFDANLSNGWNAVDGVAYGVEAQHLTFSEVMWVRTVKESADFPDTIYPDDTQEHQFLHIELRNASPFMVSLGTGTYRIVRVETQGADAGNASNGVTFHANTGGLFKQVGPGENFLIGTHEGASLVVHQPGSPDLNEVRSADLYFNTNTMDAAFEVMSPKGPNTPDPDTAPAPAPLMDLDLVHDRDQAFFTDRTFNTLTTPAEVLGPKLVGLVDPTTMVDLKQTFVLVLQRQQNPHTGGLYGDAEWVEVDRIQVTVNDFDPTDNADVPTKLQQVKSFERNQPLNVAAVEQTTYTLPHTPPTPTPTVTWAMRAHQNGGSGLQNHTLDSRIPPTFADYYKHGPNSQQGGPFDVWQPHFNRDFSSVYELLSVPLYAPDRVVERLADATHKLSGTYPILTGGVGASVAGMYFRHPNGDVNGDGTVNDPSSPSYNAALPAEVPNRWYRVLEFLEFPPRTHDTIREGLALRRRTDGRLNLNTMRNEPIFAGMIDDTVQLADTSGLTARPTADQHDAARNWFDQLITARDGLDPITGAQGLAMPSASAGTGLALPGLPGAMPFRSFTYLDPQPNGGATPQDNLLQNTLLRNHLTTTGFGLFEARSTTDVTNNNVDYHTRNRLLAKIANNSTNRSHVFAIWLGYELFEAHQPNPAVPDVVQIGARVEDLPGHREFVVVDMTRLEEAFVDDPNDNQPGRFDFRKFIIYRKRIK